MSLPLRLSLPNAQNPKRGRRRFWRGAQEGCGLVLIQKCKSNDVAKCFAGKERSQLRKY
jgi:hypothetical protein